MSPSEASGTPADYTDVLYRVYFEVGEHRSLAREVMTRFLASRCQSTPFLSSHPASITRKESGYEVAIPMQIIPELVRELALHNVAVYQVVRFNQI